MYLKNLVNNQRIKKEEGGVFIKGETHIKEITVNSWLISFV